MLTGDFNNREDVFALTVPLLPVSAVSRKIHGAAGPFDVDLIGGSIECRTGGASGVHKVIITFAMPGTFSDATITSGVGSITNTSVIGNVITIDLSGVTNAQAITITLGDVSDGSVINDVPIQMRVLLGDTNGNGAVNSTDVAQTKSQSGQPITSANFREDVSADGAINSTDISLVKSKSGTALP